MGNIIAFYLYLIVGAVTPGPNTILSMVNASKVGLRKGIKLNLGMLVGIAFIMTTCYLSSSLVVSFLPIMEKVMRVIASIYMLYLAFKCYFAKRIFDTKNENSSFIQGATMQVINAKVWFLGLTAIPSYILGHNYSKPLEFLLSLSIAITCFFCGLVWAVFGSLLSKLFKEHEKFMNTTFAILLAFFAISILR